MHDYKLAVNIDALKVHRFMEGNMAPFYLGVQRLLSKRILQEVDEQRIKADRIEKATNNPAAVYMDDSPVLEPCRGRLCTVMGLPCAHEILEMRKAERGVQVSDFIRRWHLKPPAAVVPTEIIAPPVGRYVITNHTRLNKRLKTGSEHVEAEICARDERCGFCSELGHRCNACPAVLMAFLHAVETLSDDDDWPGEQEASSSTAPAPSTKKKRAPPPPRCSKCRSLDHKASNCPDN
ncbi:hypothetical protein DFS34DRAFT_220741 [Phlyctochytrium arcticum]|nr:hypothetical protein DFS34DRAFT_220741 [Phlyctochytrium arcticum]